MEKEIKKLIKTATENGKLSEYGRIIEIGNEFLEELETPEHKLIILEFLKKIKE